MDYIDLKEDFTKEILEIKADILELTQNYKFFYYKLPTVMQQKNISDIVNNLDSKLDNLLVSVSKAEVHTIDSDIHNGILKLDELLDYRFNNKLFSNNKELQKTLASEVRDFYLKYDFTLDEIFDELQLSINNYTNIKNLVFEVYDTNTKFEYSNKLIREIINTYPQQKTTTIKNEGRNENDRELYSR